MHELYKDLLNEYHIDPVLLPQVQEMMSQEGEEEEKRLKLQLSELKKKLDTLKLRYAFGEIDREILHQIQYRAKR